MPWVFADCGLPHGAPSCFEGTHVVRHPLKHSTPKKGALIQRTAPYPPVPLFCEPPLSLHESDLGEASEEATEERLGWV